MRSFSRRYHWKEHHWNILIHEKILDHHIGIFVWPQVSNKLFFWMCVFGSMWCQMGAWGVISCGEGELTFEAPRDHRTLVPLFPRHRTSNKKCICKTSLGRVVPKSFEKSYPVSILVWAWVCPRPHNIFLWASADRYSESSKIVKIFGYLGSESSKYRTWKNSDLKYFLHMKNRDFWVAIYFEGDLSNSSI